jgi:hypothetical protein
MEKELIPLIRILFEYSPPVVATAIETHGLWGWDRYGRWGEFKPNSATCANALDAVSEVNYSIVKSRRQDPPTGWHSVLTGNVFTPLHHLGWLKGQQPNFKKFENELAKTPAFKPLENHNLRPDTELAVIGAIVDLVTCKTPRIEGHEPITQAKLIKNAVRLYGDLPGISKANLEKVFRIALEHIETFGINTQFKK